MPEGAQGAYVLRGRGRRTPVVTTPMSGIPEIVPPRRATVARERDGERLAGTLQTLFREVSA